MNLDNLIEALLFYKSEPVTIGWLSEAVAKPETEVREALSRLAEALNSRGLVLVESGDEVELGTNPKVSEIISQIVKRELSSELSKASAETLSIVLYKAPVAKSDIEYIRGVNSQFTLRNLLVRGLIKKKINPRDGRSVLYEPSLELLEHIGIKNITELPDYVEIRDKLAQIEKGDEKNLVN